MNKADIYFNIWEIRFTQDQIKWLIPILPALRLGHFPAKTTDTGYFDPQISGKGGTPKTPFARAVEVAGELDYRIEAAGLDGLLLEFLYSGDTQDMLSMMQHIGNCLGYSLDDVRRHVNSALSFVKGYRRKRCNYRDFVNHRRLSSQKIKFPVPQRHLSLKRNGE